MRGLTYDSGALIAAARGDRRMWAIHQRALMRGVRPEVPAAVLAEVFRPKQAHLDRILTGCHVEALTDVLARSAGILLGESEVDKGAVDATVVDGALRRGNAIITSNLKHLEALAKGVGRKLELIPI